jgi:uncharacterized membrane protein YfcA
MLQYWWMLPVGFAIGVLGTLVGAGGGFLLVPLLLLIYPNAEPETVTSISLAVACANASAGSVSYARMKRIDYRSGLLFAGASVPGAVLGALTTQWMPRRMFDGVFGAVLVIIALVLARRSWAKRARGESGSAGAENGGRSRLGSYNLKLGLAISAGVGFVSSVLGVGGGIMHVPALVHFLEFPVHVATATSHFVLAITAAVGTIVHIVTGEFHHGVRRAVMLGIGVVVGAPLGARLSTKMSDRWIMMGLAAALLVVGVRLVYMGVAG